MTTDMDFQIDYGVFFSPKSRLDDIASLLERALGTKGSIGFTLGDKAVSLQVREGAAPAGVQVAGQWATNGLGRAVESMGAKILSPFLFRVRRVELPHHCVFTTGRADRSIADMFLRNLFLAALAGRSVLYRRDAEPWSGDVGKRSRELGQRYLWLIVAAAHLPLLRFDSDMLELGMEEIRDGVEASMPDEDGPAALKSEFLALREGLLELYGQ
jgi:hypothetical protein